MSQRKRSQKRIIVDDNDEDESTQMSQHRRGNADSSRRRQRRTADDDEDIQTQASQRRHSQRSQGTQRRFVENDDYDAGPSKASQLKPLSNEETNQLIGSVVRYILAVDRSKHVILRQHLIKNVFKTYNKYFRVIMKRVGEAMVQVFGFKLVEFEPGRYILINAVPNDIPHLACPLQDQPNRILLFIVLSHIFMSDDVCEEDHLWNFLKQLQVVSDDNPKDNYFGDVKKLVSGEFVKQRYLDMPKIEGTDPPSYEFRWGPRAEEEVTKRRILEFVSKIYQKPIDTWTTQFESMRRTERIENMTQDDD